MTFQHYNLSPGNIHGIANWVVSTLVDRDALVVTAEDVAKVCKVGSTLYWLASVSPVTWSEMGGGGNVESPVLAFNALSPVSLTTLQNGDKVIKATVIISQAFDGTGAAVTIGTDATPGLLVGSNDIDVTDGGTYEVFPQYFATGATEIKVFLTPGTLATTGEVFISLEV